MAFNSLPRTTIACDLCAYLLGDNDDGIQHYEDEQHALEGALVQGWHQLADGRTVCDDDHHAAVLAADAVARFESAANETRMSDTPPPVSVPNRIDWCEICGEHYSAWCPGCAACACANSCDPTCKEQKR